MNIIAMNIIKQHFKNLRNSETNLYGLSSMVREYTSYPNSLPLPFFIQHFLSFYENLIFYNEVDNDFDYIATYSKRSYKLYQEASLKKPYIIPFPPLLYIKYHKIKKKDNAKGLIAFPLKNSPGCSVKFDLNTYCQELLKLDSQFFPITICLGFCDYNQKNIEICENFGFEVVTAGSSDNVDFYKIFFDILTSFEYATTASLSSTLLWATALDIPICIYPKDWEYKAYEFNKNTANRSDFLLNPKKEMDPLALEAYELFCVDMGEPINSQQKKLMYVESGFHKIDSSVVMKIKLLFLLLKSLINLTSPWIKSFIYSIYLKFFLKKIYIYGTGEAAKRAIIFFQKHKIKIAGILDDYYQNDYFESIPKILFTDKMAGKNIFIATANDELAKKMSSNLNNKMKIFFSKIISTDEDFIENMIPLKYRIYPYGDKFPYLALETLIFRGMNNV